MTRHERQLQIEQDAYDFSYDKFINELSKRIQMGAGNELPEATVLIKATIDSISDKLQEYFDAPLRGERKKDRLYLEDYFDRPNDLALLLLNETIASVSSLGEITVTSLISKITNSLYKDYVMRALNKEHPKLYSYIEREYKKRGKGYIHSRKIKLGQMKTTLSDYNLNKESLRVGAILVDVLLKSSNLIERKVKMIKDKKQTYLTYTEEAFNLIFRSRQLQIMNFMKYPIFVTKPRDWTGLKGTGGYYSRDGYKLSLIKTNKGNQRLIGEYLQAKPLTRLLPIVNNIQSTKWRINKRVYDVIDTIMTDNIVDFDSPRNNPYLLGSLPFNRQQQAEDYVNASDYGALHPPDHKYGGTPATKEGYKKWYTAIEQQKERIVVNRSKAIALNLAMIDAKTYKDEPEIYFSYQLDFRGRIYPVQQHLNPQGKGEMKALLEFADGCKLETEEELEWFLIHGANCYGFDKLLYEERINEMVKREEEIHLIASDPIRYRELWKDTDDPFLYLAWCFEYSDYLNNPNTFRSHISIALDATCSGIQIYSGLLKDKEGARAVNVIGNTREDIYQQVADKVNGYLESGDYEKQIKFNKSDGTINICDTIAEANSMKGKVSRKLTKRNTMTQPYSVTSYGMYQQILEELDAMEETGKVIWSGDKWVLARLLAQLNDKAIVATVEGARVGQEFLKQVTKEIASNGNYIFYTTPFMGFPVLQKIHKSTQTRYRTELGRIVLRTPTDIIHTAKMVSGIAPNYIHSLDATLLYMTVENMMHECDRFHLIHDSFGVPITYVPLLNKSVRQAYIDLFESNPLERFIKQVSPDKLHQVEEVMLNTLDLNEVKESAYIFS